MLLVSMAMTMTIAGDAITRPQRAAVSISEAAIMTAMTMAAVLMFVLVLFLLFPKSLSAFLYSI